MLRRAVPSVSMLCSLCTSSECIGGSNLGHFRSKRRHCCGIRGWNPPILCGHVRRTMHSQTEEIGVRSSVRTRTASYYSEL